MVRVTPFNSHFGRELLPSHQLIQNPKKQVAKHGVKQAELQNFQCLTGGSPQEYRWTSQAGALHSSHNTCFFLLCQAVPKLRVSFVLPFDPLFSLTCPSLRALNKAAIGLGSSTVQYCWSSYKLTGNGKMKNNNIWYYSTAIACNMNYGFTHSCLCFFLTWFKWVVDWK